LPTDGTRCPVYGKGCPTDGKGGFSQTGKEAVKLEIDECRDEALFRRLAMSWEDVAERFPYGLPASLRHGARRWFRSSNVVDLEQWRQRKKEAETEQGPPIAS
jgi:hypothetical protein